MNSRHVKLDSGENMTNLDSTGGDSYKFTSKKQKSNRFKCLNSEQTQLNGSW